MNAVRALAGPGGRSYLAAVALLAAGVASCARVPGPPAPVGAYQPMSAAAFGAVAAATVPRTSELWWIRWRLTNGSDAPIGGRGAVRVAPPDSLRLDVGVPVMGRATLVLAGDSVWSEPPRLGAQVLPGEAVLWAMLGVVRPPAGTVRIERGEADGRALYRLTGADGAVTTLELRGDTLLAATVVRGTRTVGRLDLARDARGAIVRAVTVDVERGARFEMDVDRRQSGEVFPREIWTHP